MQKLKQYYQTLNARLVVPQTDENKELLNWLNSDQDLNLIQLSKQLYSIALLNQKHQQVEFTPEFIQSLDDSEKTTLTNSLIQLHKSLTHFIIKNKDLNVS